MTGGPPRPAGCHILRTTAQLVASLAYEGPPSGVSAAFDRVINWARVYNLEQWGPLVGVYRDASGVEDEDLVAEVWVPLPPGLDDVVHRDDEVVVKRVPSLTVAAVIHTGFPDDLGEALRALSEWVSARGLRRTTRHHRQVYRAAPPGRPGEWEVELQLPVEPPSGESEG